MRHRTAKRLPAALLIFGLSSTLGLVAAPADANTVKKPDVTVPVTRDQVEIVFALDTTSSMSGLIEGAKRKIWFIANEVLKSERKPRLRVGLVAYRDKGDAYVTKVTPLTDDLDAVYNELMALSTAGGGDFPEHVNAALDVAVNQMDWSQGNNTLKLVFLVGDAPPKMNYKDDIKHAVTSQKAVRRNIYINTVQCGSSGDTTAVWKKIARNSEGRYAAIPQNGGVVAVATPFDEEMSKLARDLDATEMAYGDRRTRERRSSISAKSSGYAGGAPSVAADRASVKLKVSSRDKDLISLASEDEEALDKISDDRLPDELRKKSKKERKKFVKARVAKQKQIKRKLAELEKKRSKFIQKEQAKRKKGAGLDSFDAEVVEAIEAQAEAAGMDL